MVSQFSQNNANKLAAREWVAKAIKDNGANHSGYETEQLEDAVFKALQAMNRQLTERNISDEEPSMQLLNKQLRVMVMEGTGEFLKAYRAQLKEQSSEVAGYGGEKKMVEGEMKEVADNALRVMAHGLDIETSLRKTRGPRHHERPLEIRIHHSRKHQGTLSK